MRFWKYKKKKREKSKQTKEKEKEEKKWGAFITLALTRFFDWKEVTGLDGRSRAKKSLRKNRGENRWLSFSPLSLLRDWPTWSRFARLHDGRSMPRVGHPTILARFPPTQPRDVACLHSLFHVNIAVSTMMTTKRVSTRLREQLCIPWFLVRRFESKGCAWQPIPRWRWLHRFAGLVYTRCLYIYVPLLNGF